MTQLKELRKQVKERSLTGYPTMRRADLELALADNPVPKRLRKNQVSIGTQTDFQICYECGKKQYITHLYFKADANRKIAAVDAMAD